LDITLPTGEDKLMAKLIKQFPKEEENINKYFKLATD